MALKFGSREISRVRVGIGFDVHEFGPHRRFMLGGVRVPHLVGLLGHSDADVLLHAVCDALLGAAGLGDIGEHFPNTSPKLKNISSVILLTRVGAIVRKAGATIGNIDSTVILDRPKISQLIPRMRRSIARALAIRASQVSVKATTNEGLGFIGRGEGCAALAVALLTMQGER